MIDKDIIDFLKELNLNNNKEWFHANKTLYSKARTGFEKTVTGLIAETARFDPEIKNNAPKDCIFRIFRDVRFSHDKRPYKTNFGAYMVKGGKKGGFAGYYLHVEPGASFLGGGVYCPEPDTLKAIRESIVDYTGEYKTIIEDKAFTRIFGGIRGDKLKLPPKGFDKDWPDIDLIKFKDYTVMKQVSDEFLLSPGGLEESLKIFKAMTPLNTFLNRAITQI